MTAGFKLGFRANHWTRICCFSVLIFYHCKISVKFCFESSAHGLDLLSSALFLDLFEELGERVMQMPVPTELKVTYAVVHVKIKLF